MVGAEWLSVERDRLSNTVIDAPRHYRIMAVGRKANGATDIVACLERALRNLGHHLLFLDLKAHPKIVENPYQKQGGNGPIYLRLDDIKASVQRFRPQLLILLAGGLALRESDAAWLKAQGIVCVGLTLSDPDVFESVQNFAHSFDFHSTNSLAAMHMYNRVGLDNTLHFPFGVDRAFVAQHVSVQPEYDADVICLGHATAHPIRDRVMCAVHERIGECFKIRSYGRGWSLPESRAVEGLEVLQASRGGRIHVNFPMTRAGFTNVKCGVFETVASGGILLTRRFDEMALFFDYEDEIAGYDEFDEIPTVVETLLADRSRMEEMRRRSFRRLVEDHLYEHRWNRFFEEIVSQAQAQPAWLSGSRAGEIQEILSVDAGRSRLIALSGFYGARNLGDDLIMNSISTAVEKEVDGAQVVIVAQNPEVVELECGRQAVGRNKHHAVDAMVAKCDGFLLGGGGLWHDYTFQKAGGLRSIATGATMSIAGVSIGGMLAHLRNIPFHAVGLGVGPLSDPDAARLVKFVAGMTESITVRDMESKSLLSWAGVNDDKVTVAPDVVYALPLAGEAPAELGALRDSHFVLGVNLRPWERGETPLSALLEQVAEAIRQFAHTLTRPLALVLLPMQEGASFDRAVLAQFARSIGDNYPVFELSHPLREEEFIGALGCIDLLVSMRLHCCLLAHRLGKPVVGLAYDPKITAHFQELARSELALPLSATAACLTDAFGRAVQEFDPTDLNARVSALTDLATTALRRIGSSLEESEPRSVIWGVDDGPAAHETGGGSSTTAQRRRGREESMPPPPEAQSLGRSGARRVFTSALTTSLLGKFKPGASQSASPPANFKRTPAAAATFEDLPTASPPVNMKGALAAAASFEDGATVKESVEEASYAVQAGELGTALDILSYVRRIDPDNVDAITLLISIHARQQNWKRLSYYIEKAHRFPELQRLALTARYEMYLAQGKDGLAARLLKGLPEEDPLRADLARRRTEHVRARA